MMFSWLNLAAEKKDIQVNKLYGKAARSAIPKY